jgi:isoleucyl-tRNA synthetase
VDGATVRAAFERDGGYDLALGDGTTLRLEPDDVEVRAASHEEFALAQEGGYAVAIDTLVDDELRAEGIARDLIRLLNDLRKAQGLEIADRIRVRLGATGRVEAAAHLHRDWIAREVLAVEFEVDASFLGGTALDVDGATVSVWLERVEQ